MISDKRLDRNICKPHRLLSADNTMRNDINKSSLTRLQNTLTPVVGDKSIFDESLG